MAPRICAFIRRVPAAAGIALLAVAAFSPSLWAGRTADDFVYERTLAGIDSLGDAFTTNDLGEAGASGHFFRPAWVLWGKLVDVAGGSDALAFHVANVVLYVAIVLLVWRIGVALLPRSGALVAVAAFAVYPRHAESVSWISGSTDLVAALPALGAVCVALARWPLPARAVGCALLTLVAALGKESAFAVPGLVALAVLALPAARRPARPLATAAALGAASLAAVVGVLVWRDAVIGGLGGYGAGWSVQEVAVGLGSYAIAALTPSQLEVLREPVWLAVPALLAAALAVRLVRPGVPRSARRTLVAGLGWFVVALVPVLQLAVDLNTANGERFMFLASAGLALAAGALFTPASRYALAGTAAVLTCLLGLSIHASTSWIEASRIAERSVAAVAARAPQDATVVLAVAPSSYRNAHILLGINLQAALELRGRADLRTALCLEAHVRRNAPGQIALVATDDAGVAGGVFAAEATGSAGFDFPVLRQPGATAECSWRLPGGRESRRGLEQHAELTLGAIPEPVLVLAFDGQDLRAINTR